LRQHEDAPVARLRVEAGLTHSRSPAPHGKDGQALRIAPMPIWCAVGVLVLEGIWHLYQQNNKRKNLALNIEKLDERIG
ncbi:MAG: hypothetical protein AAB326_12675, partial [Pseudomonadota bacterium]